MFIEDDELLETYNDILNKIGNSNKKELGCEPIYNKKFLKIKIRTYGHEATDFEIPKVGSNHTCLAVILIDFVLKKRWKLLSASVENTLKKKKGY